MLILSIILISITVAYIVSTDDKEGRKVVSSKLIVQIIKLLFR